MNRRELIGKRLDHYHILSNLSEGDLASAYLALDTQMRRYTIVKVIHSRLLTQPGRLERLADELAKAAELEHPNIVRLYEHGQVEGLTYVAVEHVLGVELSAVLAAYRENGESLPHDDARRIVIDICRGVQHAHDQGAVHGYLTPRAVVLDQQGKAAVADFGLASLLWEKMKDISPATLAYAAPEWLDSPAQASPAADVFAIGALMYVCFTGVPPFPSGRNDEEEPGELVERTLTPPQTVQPAIGSELASVMLTAIAPDPAERYESAAALSNALADVLGGDASEKDARRTLFTLHTVPAAMQAGREPANRTRGTLVMPIAVGGGFTPPLPAGGRPRASPYTAGPTRSILAIPATVRNAMPESLFTLPLIPLAGCAVLLLVAVALAAALFIARNRPAASTRIWLPLVVSGAESPPSLSAGAYPVGATGPPGERGAVDSQGEENPTGALLQISTNSEDSLFLVNVGGEIVPLGDLRLVSDESTIHGSQWGIAALAPGDCVSVWKDRGNPQPPAVECNGVGERLQQSPSDIIWKRSFGIFFQDELVVDCSSSGCRFGLPLP